MTPDYDLETIELGPRIAHGGMWNEGPTDVTARLRNMARVAVLKDARRRPGQRRPRLLRGTTIVGSG